MLLRSRCWSFRAVVERDKGLVVTVGWDGTTQQVESVLFHSPGLGKALPVNLWITLSRLCQASTCMVDEPPGHVFSHSS